MTHRHAVAIALMLVGLLALGGCRQATPPQQPKGEPPPAREVRREPPPSPVAPPLPKGEGVAEKEPPKPAPRISPERWTLAPGDVGLQLLVDIEGLRGGRRDLTATASYRAEPEGVVAIDAGGYVRPVGPGKATVRAIHDDAVATAEVTVEEDATEGRPWDFAADIVPLLTRAGCNTGGCHGKADGQNGFHLSLFGYDPEGDYRAMTRQEGGRRVDRLDPESSLVIRKATGRTPHGGGQPIAPGSDSYRTLVAWIAAGAPEASGQTHGDLAEVTVEPGGVRLEEPGPQQLRVVARFQDGHLRDVTRQAIFRTNDDTASGIEPDGQARLTRRAEVDLIVRYQSRVVATRVATLINPDLDFDFAALPRRNVIDEELYKRLAALKVPPSPPADDATFLRRVYLDLIGRQPMPLEIKAFLEDPDAEKRVKVVDALMKDSRFMRFWKIKFGDLLAITSNRFPNTSGPYQYWLERRLQENAPWNTMVSELLTALGNPSDLYEGGPVNYALDGEDAKVQAELTAQRFLGLRLRCAQCHDHPFDVWTQDDYYGLAAFFAKVRRGGGPNPNPAMNRLEVSIDPEGKVEHPRTKQTANPTLLGGERVEVADGDDPRKALAQWITAPDNPFFARAMANWVWAQLFGRGLADPADDLSRSNPPVHPDLLDALASHFIAHDYDVRDLIRTVAVSHAYGASSATVEGNEQDRRLFSHQAARPLTAHQMADCLAQATDVPNRFQNLGVRDAVEVFDPSVPSTILDTFGRCPRTNGCGSVATPSLSLRQALLLIGGDEVDGKVSHLNGYLAELLKYGTEPTDLVENLYLRALCREPTPEESSHWVALLESSESTREAAEDLFWALLNSREFAFNH